MKILKWISASFEGNDGNLSSKKASVFAFTFMFFLMITLTAIVKYKHPEAAQIFPDVAYIMAATGAGVIAGIQANQSIKQSNK